MQYVIKPVLKIIIVLMVIFSAFAPINSYAAWLGGSWEGQVTQNAPLSTYPVKMSLYGNTGNTNYPTLGCGGNLEYLNTDGTIFWYRERITFGKDKCIDGGIIQFRRNAPGDNTHWDWQWGGSGISVRGLIHGSGVEESK